jgi:D-alanyl-lipoteichoic acid acyltransferase DltB (MBOAT superfamily)
MLFNSTDFVVGFLPATLAGVYLLALLFGSFEARIWMLVANAFFYAWWNPVFLMLLVGSILMNFFFGAKIRKTQACREWLIAGLVFNLGLLAFFKYSDFLARMIGMGLPFGGVELPLGISFFTFQQIMFIVDTYREGGAEVSLVDYACFVSFFPHLIAGPIVRPKNIIPQFYNFQPLTNWKQNLVEGLEIVLLGLAKKLVLADGLAQFSDPGFAAAALHDRLTLVEAWVALLAYGLQIYFDFSGYSDMAIGLARMFGIDFPQNFCSPYRARNISDFWKRWNISLSSFLRDYLYIPLGGNRRGEVRRTFNVIATMLLGGLWHGAALRFILWGGLHGAFLILHGWFKRTGIRLPPFLAQAITLAAVLIAWVPFRASSFPACIEFYRGLLGLNGITLPAMIIQHAPWLHRVAQSAPVLPYLGDARTLSLPEGVLLLCIGWAGALLLPDIHRFTRPVRSLALVSSFAFTVQALFFAPFTVPFLYFQF